MIRATMSTALPGDDAAITRTGLFGYVCWASAAGVAKPGTSPTAKQKAVRPFMTVLLSSPRFSHHRISDHVRHFHYSTRFVILFRNSTRASFALGVCRG